MYIAVNAWAFPEGATAAERLEATARAGFDGIELTLDDDGPLCPDTPLDVFETLAHRAADLPLRVVGLATALFWEFNYASPEAADRRRAHDLTLQMLDRAAAVGAGAILVVPALVGKVGDSRATVSYADALYRTADALSTLRYEAEVRGVTIAIENVWNRFLLSPLEAADLIDRVNSPQVGFYFDTGNVLAYGYPEDWIATLGGRIARVHIKDYDLRRPGSDGFCELGEGSVNWPVVVNSLRNVGYDGPLTYEGGGDVHEVARRMRNILAGRPPRESEV